MKKLWLIWAPNRVGRTDDDEPDIPILSLKDANLAKNNYCIIKYDNLLVHYSKHN